MTSRERFYLTGEKWTAPIASLYELKFDIPMITTFVLA
jgi:hypothetical protein